MIAATCRAAAVQRGPLGLAARTALGRVGEPDAIGLAIASLVSEAGRWVIAQNIEVSGGF
ncbi:hypothetical protein [Kutzneria buriramensis]|nr:hypothetical protein [Kutzneria buriramensis]